MNVFFIQSAVVAIICGLMTLTFHAVTHNRRKRNETIFTMLMGKMLSQIEGQKVQDVRSRREGDRVVIPELPTPRWVKIGKVTQLQACPLVSGKGSAVDECHVKSEGMYMYKNGELINWDRSFMVYYEDSKDIVTTNNFPTLDKVDLSIKDDYIMLQADGMPSLCIKLRDAEIVECTYWCCNKIQPIPKLVCTDCGDKAAQWLSRFLWGRNSGLRLGYGINAVGCMGIYWQVILRNCIMYQKAKRNKHSLSPFINVLHSVLITPTLYDNISEVLTTFESKEAICPNIIVSAPNFHANENWEWIRIGKVVIKNTQPLVHSRNNPTIMNVKFFGLEVNCELYVSGSVKVNDNVYLHIPEDRNLKN